MTIFVFPGGWMAWDRDRSGCDQRSSIVSRAQALSARGPADGEGLAVRFEVEAF